MNKKDKRYVGQAGEYRVVSELLLRGFDPCMVPVDNGIDLVIVSSLLRLQVKTAHLRNDGRSGIRYIFETRRSYYRRDITQEKNRSLTYTEYKKKVDFFICFGVDTNSFYIFPVSEMPNGPISIYPYREDKKKDGRPSKYQKYENAWFLLGEPK